MGRSAGLRARGVPSPDRADRCADVEWYALADEMSLPAHTNSFRLFSPEAGRGKRAGNLAALGLAGVRLILVLQNPRLQRKQQSQLRHMGIWRNIAALLKPVGAAAADYSPRARVVGARGWGALLSLL